MKVVRPERSAAKSKDVALSTSTPAQAPTLSVNGALGLISGPHDGVDLLDEFCDSLWLEDGLSRNTLDSYRRDLRKFASWLEKQRDTSILQTTHGDIQGYLAQLVAVQKAKPSSTGRNISSLKRLFRYLLRQGSHLAPSVDAGVGAAGAGQFDRSADDHLDRGAEFTHHRADTFALREAAEVGAVVGEDEAVGGHGASF